MTRTVLIKFEGQLIRTELPLQPLFTGDISLKFHWKEGKLMSASASRTASAEFEEEKLSTFGTLQADNLDS